MNRGLLRAFQRQRKNDRPWVYYPLFGYTSATPTDGTGATADVTVTLTRDVAGMNGIPSDGSVRAFRVLLIARGTTVNNQSLYAYNYENIREPEGTEMVVVGAVSPGGVGIPCYGGKVSGIYDSNIGFVTTGGVNNTQFKYAVNWGAGTFTYYVRIVGYYREAE